MPLVEVKVIEGVFSEEKRRQIVEGLTEAMVAIEGEGLRGVTVGARRRGPQRRVGIGGRPITTEDVRSLAAGAAS